MKLTLNQQICHCSRHKSFFDAHLASGTEIGYKAESVYTEYNPVDDRKPKDGFAKLRSQFPNLSLQKFDPVFTIVSDLCTDHERLAFYESLRLGVTLTQELKEVET